MFWPMIDSACVDLGSSSRSIATRIAARTSGGRSVEVLTMSATSESR